jgi:hypothetical protein
MIGRIACCTGGAGESGLSPLGGDGGGLHDGAVESNTVPRMLPEICWAKTTAGDQNDQGARQTSEVTHVPHSPETKCVTCLFAGLGIDFVDYNGTRSSALKDPSCSRDFLASEGQ